MHDRRQFSENVLCHQNLRGFTVIEMMVAVSIVTMLMLAMSAATNIYMTTATDSFEEIERSQVVRAVFRNMSRDIRTVTFVEKDMDDEDDEALESDTVDADTAMASYTDGLFGTETDLVLYISRPDADASYVSAQSLTDANGRSSDGMIIRYFLAESGGGPLSGMVAEQELSKGLNVENGVAGLAVMKGDLIGLSNAINVGDIERQLQASSLVSPEVTGLKFSYFDGVDELPEWDSNVDNIMPVAVIVELTLRTIRPEWDERDPENTPGLLDETTHRMVIPITVADPYIAETAI